MSDTDKNLESEFASLFGASVSGSGEEELLRIASRYSLQISATQIKALLFLEFLSNIAPSLGWIKDFISRWLQLKENNNSDLFVMKALEYISLRKFLGENSFKVNIEKR